MKSFRFAALTLALAAITAAGAQTTNTDWAQWRGPRRDGISLEKGLLKTWPAGGPKQVWKAESLGGGYGSVAVSKGRIYGMGYRNPDEAVWCLDAATGRGLWATPIAQANRRGKGYGDGSRCTPTVDGNLVFVEGDSGDIACLDAASGQIRWKKDLVTDFGGRVPGWGFTESPLVDGNKVILTPGGRAASIVALDKNTGEVIWKSVVPEGDAAGYSSAIIATVNGQRQYIQFMSGGVIGIAAADGKFLWRYNSPANRTANISTPIYRDGHVFAATAYNTGGGLAKLNGSTADEVYFTRNMQNHHGGMVLVGEHLYGFNNSNLTCINFLTGAVAWENRSVGKGSVTAVDGMLICRGEGREIALVEANPAQYVEKGRFAQPERSGKSAWAHPVVANGKLYLRDQDIMFCYDVKQP